MTLEVIRTASLGDCVTVINIFRCPLLPNDLFYERGKTLEEIEKTQDTQGCYFVTTRNTYSMEHELRFKI